MERGAQKADRSENCSQKSNTPTFKKKINPEWD
jgi:hypothetical protein